MTLAADRLWSAEQQGWLRALGHAIYLPADWPTEAGAETLDQAEEAMLALYGERAALADGQDILELGCGWGSLTLWMAARYPNARITAVSNSNSQRQFIEARCAERGLRNVRVITCDVNQLQLEPQAFDRCVSVEMFEHVSNHAALMRRIHDALRPAGSATGLPPSSTAPRGRCASGGSRRRPGRLRGIGGAVRRAARS